MTEIYRSEAGAQLLRERYRQALDAWPVGNERFQVPTPEGATFVIASGPSTAPPLVLLHGSGSNATQWMDRIVNLAARFRVYAVDVIGEPGLSAPSRPPLDSDRYALWLDAVLDHLELATVPITGVSLGGWLALDYATRHPDRVSGLALSCPRGLGRNKAGFLFKAMLLRPLGDWGQHRTVRGMLGPALETLPPGETERVIEQVRLVSAHYRYRSGTVPMFGADALGKLRMPVHAVFGQEDVTLDAAEAASRLTAAVPHATVRLLPEVGHFIPAQESELEFLTAATP